MRKFSGPNSANSGRSRSIFRCLRRWSIWKSGLRREVVWKRRIRARNVPRLWRTGRAFCRGRAPDGRDWHIRAAFRLLRRPVWNFGFAGNARGEASVARLLASLESPGAFLLDYDVNTTADSLRQTLPEFIRILRERHPETPLFIFPALPFRRTSAGRRPFVPSDRACPHSSGRGRALSPLGERNLHFVDGSLLLGQESAESSADGCHLNDSGFRLFAGIWPESSGTFSGIQPESRPGNTFFESWD